MVTGGVRRTPVLVAASGAGWEAAAVRRLEQAPDLVLHRRSVDLADLLASAGTGLARCAVVADTLSGLDADAVAHLGRAGVRVVAVLSSGDSETRSRLVRIGVARLLDATDLDEICAAVREVAVDQENPAPGSVDGDPNDPTATTGRGRLTVVWGPTGAPGRSTVALGLAAAAAQRRIPTLLVDADVYGGATGQMLAVLDEVSGVLAAVRTAAEGSLDPDRLAAAAREIGPNLRVLTGLPRADRWTALRPAAVRELLAVARRQHRLVVVDCGFCIEQDEELSFDTAAPRRNGATTTVLEQADLVVAVGSADPLGLTRLARARGDLRELVPTAEVRLVVNRVRSGLGWSRDEVAATLLTAIGEVPLAFLPQDQAAVDQAWLTGRTLPEAAPSSGLTAALDVLAADVAAELGLAPGPGRTRHRRRDRRLVRR